MNIDKQYQKLLLDIIHNGVEKKDRTGTGTISVFGRQIRHKMSEGFPLLTTKKVHWKSIVTELLWFLKGRSDLKYLLDNDCNIWTGDVYKNFQKTYEGRDGEIILPPDDYINDDGELLSKEQFIEKIKTDESFAKRFGELGPVYGKQWRSWETKEKIDFKILNNSDGLKIGQSSLYTPPTVDQIANLISELKTNPDSRRLMVNAWNVGELDQMVLPPCHYGFQVYTRELSMEERNKWSWDNWGITCEMESVLDEQEVPKRAISLMYNTRSQDVPLGTPFNIASYALLLEIIAKEVNMVPDELIANMGDCHIYLNQIDGVKEQLTREPYPLPKLKILDSKVDDIAHYEIGDFIIEGYQSHPAIKMPLSN